MKRIIRLTESDLISIVKRVIKEQNSSTVAGLKTAIETSYQFDANYFKKNPSGTITMTPDDTFPRIEKINNMNVKDSDNFNSHWDADGQDFGRGFRSGDGRFKYSWDGSKLNIIGGSCRPNYCYYNPA